MPHPSRWLLLSVFIMSNIYALPFNIVPKEGTQFPTTINIGTPVTAYYTVTNLTQSQRNGNYVKWLPGNVTQVTSDGDFSDTCGSTFDLAGAGQSGDSCTLQLTITGSVSASSPVPHQHLFVCFPGGKTCAGTNYPLNVTALSTYVYTTNDDTNSVSRCVLDASGIVGQCVDLGNPGANLINPAGITLNQTSTQAYIANGLLGASPSSVSLCTISADMRFNQCQNSGDNLFYNPSSVVINPAGTIAYIPNTMIDATPLISKCVILEDGSLASCTEANGSELDNPFGIAFTADGNHAYITNVSSGNVYYCEVDGDGNFINCEDTDYNCDDQPGTQPYGIALSPGGNIAYIMDGAEPSLIVACPIEDNGLFGECVSAAEGLTDSVFSNGTLRLNTAGTMGYITGAGTSSLLFSCPIISDGMAFDVANCVAVNGVGHVYGIASTALSGL